jgi:uncharacterized protein (UPF0371 family)
MYKIAFDNDRYVTMQSAKIAERIGQFDNKLYLEFGGKLFDDFHASRVLPGFQPDSKIRMLQQLKDMAEIVIAINANDIEKSKVRSDLGITYDQDVTRLIDAFRNCGLLVSYVVITQYAQQPSAMAFREKLTKLGIRTALHYPIAGYPANTSLIVSDEGYGKNEYLQTTRPLVVVTAPGPGSGKLAVCLSQLYQEQKHGIKAGYAKFETFPIWNLPLQHPVNLAYEAATADLNDVNMIDPYHLEAYHTQAVNYNRDVEAFPLLRTLLEKIQGSSVYRSPTDMGVNMAGYCIIDDQAAQDASRNEIIRRYYRAQVDNRRALGSQQEVNKIELLMNQAGVDANFRTCAVAARIKADATAEPAVAIELADGRIVTGKTSKLLGASSAALLNALKVLGGIDDSVELISASTIEPIQALKTGKLGSHNPRLHTDEALIALAISASNNVASHNAIEQLPKLAYAEAHSTVILSEVDSGMFKKLKVNLTMDPVYQSKSLYHKK